MDVVNAVFDDELGVVVLVDDDDALVAVDEGSEERNDLKPSFALFLKSLPNCFNSAVVVDPVVVVVVVVDDDDDDGFGIDDVEEDRLDLVVEAEVMVAEAEEVVVAEAEAVMVAEEVVEGGMERGIEFSPSNASTPPSVNGSGEDDA